VAGDEPVRVLMVGAERPEIALRNRDRSKISASALWTQSTETAAGSRQPISPRHRVGSVVEMAAYSLDQLVQHLVELDVVLDYSHVPALLEPERLGSW
jgi:hypothetical protein